MSERTAKWLTRLAPVLFALSLLVPPGPTVRGGREDFGFQLFVLSFYGTLWGIPVCGVGAFGNMMFLLAGLLLLIRVARGRPWPSYRTIAIVSTLSFVAMAVSRTWISLMEGTPLLGFGAVLWVASSLVLAVGAWRLRTDSKMALARGFDVIPVASVATPQQIQRSADSPISSERT